MGTVINDRPDFYAKCIDALKDETVDVIISCGNALDSSVFRELPENIKVYPYGAITKCEMGEELSNMEEIAEKIVAFSDDGKGIQEEKMMKEAMIKAKELNKIIAAHCEVNSLLNGGYIHDRRICKITQS